MALSEAANKKKYLRYLYTQYKKGILQPDKIELLEREGFIGIGKSGYTPSEEKALRIDESWEKMMDPFSDSGSYYLYKKDLKKEDWMPESVLNHSQEFVKWINSMVYGLFPNKADYKKFTLYKVQAFRWLEDDDNISSYHTEDAQRDYKIREYNRCDENSLYFVNRYGELKEGDISSGFVKYQAREHHAVICYLFDCGYNVIGGKGRQIGFTSIMGLLALKKLIFQPNYYIKFVTEDKDTGEEIFNDKVKYPFGAIPRWMAPKVKSDSGTRFWLSDKSKKGEKGYPNSRIDVIAPKVTAINGGSPQLALVDEIGNVGILGAMLNEARPTMFWNNPKTGKFELKRQVWMWGCVCAGSKIITNDGRQINVEDLRKEDGIIGFNQGDGKVSHEDITYMQPPASKPCYRIITKQGTILECSEDHPILSSNAHLYTTPKINGIKSYKKGVEWKETKDIKIGDQIAMVSILDIFGSSRMMYPRLMGWLVGDGSYGIDKTPVLSTADDEIAQEVLSMHDAIVEKDYITKDGRVYREIRIKGITKLLRDIGIYGQTKTNKRIPDIINSCVKGDIVEFLGGLFDTDGYVCVGDTNRYITLTSSSDNMLREVKLLLQRIGIHSSISRIKARIKEGRKDVNDWFELRISDKDSIGLFYKDIQFRVNTKQNALIKLFNVTRNIQVKSKSINVKGIVFESVKVIEYIGIKPIYNLTAGNTHTYIANGIITHNTGGKMEKGKGEYEKEWYRILGLWEAKNYSNGFVPLFFSWHCRFDKQEYVKEKNWYYGARAMKEDIDLETSKTQFHQHYPSSFKDMFLTTASTLVSREIIEGGIDRCRKAAPAMQPVYGYFEPIFDESDPMPPESDIPYRILGANFVAIDDTDDFKKASVCIFRMPQPLWKDRYYKGTDPIATETGHSKFASGIWDDYEKTIPAVMNFRQQHDHKYTFLQSLLLNIFYDTATPGVKTGIKELVEANIGTNYIDYMEAKGFFSTMVFNSQLPNKVVGGARLVGIDNKGNRANGIVEYMTELLRNYHDRFYIPAIFEQLTTFVQDLTKSGKETWGPMNKLMHFDDILYAITFAYICRLSHMNLQPIHLDNASSRMVVKHKLVRTGNWDVKRVPVKVPVYGGAGDGSFSNLGNYD